MKLRPAVLVTVIGTRVSILLLGAIARAQITLTRVDVAGRRHWHLTPLPPLLERTLACLSLSPSLYQRLIENST